MAEDILAFLNTLKIHSFLNIYPFVLVLYFQYFLTELGHKIYNHISVRRGPSLFTP